MDGLADDQQRAETLKQLLALQRPDGGWSTPGLLADWKGLVDGLSIRTQAFVGGEYVDAASGLLLPFFWHLRNPLLWWAYFAVGWLVRTHYDAVRGWLVPRRGAAVLALASLVAALSALSGLEGPRLLVRARLGAALDAQLHPARMTRRWPGVEPRVYEWNPPLTEQEFGLA